MEKLATLERYIDARHLASNTSIAATAAAKHNSGHNLAAALQAEKAADKAEKAARKAAVAAYGTEDAMTKAFNDYFK